MAAPMASTGAQIRNLRRTRWSCTRPRATQAAQRVSNSASGTTAGLADTAVTGSRATVSALPMYFSPFEAPPMVAATYQLWPRFTARAVQWRTLCREASELR